MKTNLLTGKVRASYVKLTAPDELSKKYCVTLIIPKTDRKTYDALMADVKRAADDYRARGGKKNLERMHTIHDGDLPSPRGADYGAECKNSWVVRTSNKVVPKCFDRHGVGIIDMNEIYSGCYIRALVHAFAYDNQSGSGIGFTIDGIQKWADGERLGGGYEANANDFADGYVDPDGDDYGLGAL